MAVELELADSERMEEAGLLLCAANPWHGPTWRSGRFAIRVARTEGYGAAAGLLRALLRRCDDAGIAGLVRRTAALEAVSPVGTQGPVL